MLGSRWARHHPRLESGFERVAVVFALAAIVLVEAEIALVFVLVEVDTGAQRPLESEAELTMTLPGYSSGMQQGVKPAPAQLASQSGSSPPTVLASAHETAAAAAAAAGSVVVATHTSVAS